MTSWNLKQLLKPRAVALIGASSQPNRVTARPWQFLRAHDFAGDIFPVNPQRTEVGGLPCIPHISELPSHTDHAYILLNTQHVEEALRACGQQGIKTVSILADGFAERGPEGLRAQQRLVDIATDHGMALIGPNSMGIVYQNGGFVCTTNAAFKATPLRSGRFAVLSQSGSVIGAIRSRGDAVGVGFGCFISLGNEAQLGVGELGCQLVDHEEFDGFLLFLETIRRPEAYEEFANRARKLGKSITAFVVGRSEAGKKLAQAHTGAMVAGPKAIDAFLKGHAIDVAESFSSLIEMPRGLRLRKQQENRPKHAMVLTTTGGGGGMMLDRLAMHNIPLQGPSERVRRLLADKDINISAAPLVDVTLAGAQYDIMHAIITALLADPDTGLLVIAIGSSAQFNPELAIQPIIDAIHQASENRPPVLVAPIPHAPESLHLLGAHDIPGFGTIESCAETAANIMQPRRAVGRPSSSSNQTTRLITHDLHEIEAYQFLEPLGFQAPPFAMINSVDAPFPKLEFEGPFAIKLVSRQIAHKSDIGGVRLGLQTIDEVKQAIQDMDAHLKSNHPDVKIDGFMVSQMVSGMAELIIGYLIDPVVGPMINVGAGGIWTELLNDHATRPAPIDTATALDMLNELKITSLLRGYRGAAPANVEQIAHLISQLSQCACNPSIHVAEINPLVVRPEPLAPLILDALIHTSNCG